MFKKCEVIQNSFKSCGASCLLSIIRHYGGDVSLDELAYIMKTDNNGTSAYNIICASRYLGFDGYGMKCSMDEMISLGTFPIIAHVIKNNMYHFVVIYKIEKKILIMDPEVGFTKISKDNFKEMFLGTILVIYPCKKIIGCAKNNFKSYFINSLFSIKRNIIVLSLITLIVIILSLLNYIILKYFIDNYKFNILVFIIFIIIIFIKSICDYFRMNKLIFINNSLSKNLNNKFFRHLFSLPYLFFKNKTTGEVVNRANDIDKLRDIISMFINVITDVLFMIFSIFFLCYININMFIITLCFMIIFIIISIIFYKLSKSKIYDVQMSSDEYNKNISESIYGYETNKNINLLGDICKKNEMVFNKYIRANSSYDKLFIKEYLIKDIIISLCQIFVILFGIYYINLGYITIGDFIIFNSLILYFIDPIKNIMSLLPNINYIKEIINRINSLIMFSGEEIKEDSQMIRGDINISNLSFSYNNKDILFKDINLYINYNSHIMIYAPSGRGKSTILKIILKYLTDYSGNIYINDINIKDIDASIIASSFTYVSQNNYLNNDTLKNNIIYFRDTSQTEYEKVIKLCHIDKIRDNNKLRDNFMIEENGFNLSGGERQKVIVARSLLKKSNYILLDEAFSEVSPDEEKILIKNIRKSYKDKCIIYISHKKEICECFDEVINF